MAKFYGMIGFIDTVEKAPDVWEPVQEERPYYGDITRNTRRWQSGESLNDDITLDNVISILSDDFAIKNIGMMKYIDWNGTKWKISNIHIEYPRIVLTIGGIYNGRK